MPTPTPAAQAAARPPVKGGLTTYLEVDGASAAAEYYKKAFGATEVFRFPVDDKGRTMHIHLYINGSSLMLSDPYPEHGHPHQPAQGYSLVLNLQADEIDGWWKRATEAGAEVMLPLQVMFWGDRYGDLRDPFGVRWAMNAPVTAAAAA